jgi:hypothetical protein
MCTNCDISWKLGRCNCCVEGVKLDLEILDYLMRCDLGNICAKAERKTSEKSVNEN